MTEWQADVRVTVVRNVIVKADSREEAIYQIDKGNWENNSGDLDVIDWERETTPTLLSKG